MGNPSPDAGVLRITIGAAPPDRLDKALARDVPEEAALSRSRLMRMIADGDVTQDGVAVTDPKAKVSEGDVFEISVGEAVEVATEAEDIPLTVVWEDADLIVIDKPVGMVVHPAPGSSSGTLVNALLHHFGDNLSGVGGEKRPGIVHRIDKDTSGLLVVAKSDRAHHGLARAVRGRTTSTVAIWRLCMACRTPPTPGCAASAGSASSRAGSCKIATQLARHKTDRQRQAVLEQGGRHAVTRARVIESFGTPPAAALLECWLETGRTHQIRVHMAHVGHALIGDQTYGGRRRLCGEAGRRCCGGGREHFPRQALHAATLGFEHPVTGERLEFVSPLPADMEGLDRDVTQR